MNKRKIEIRKNLSGFILILLIIFLSNFLFQGFKLNRTFLIGYAFGQSNIKPPEVQTYPKPPKVEPKPKPDFFQPVPQEPCKGDIVVFPSFITIKYISRYGLSTLNLNQGQTGSVLVHENQVGGDGKVELTINYRLYNTTNKYLKLEFVCITYGSAQNSFCYSQRNIIFRPKENKNFEQKIRVTPTSNIVQFVLMGPRMLCNGDDTQVVFFNAGLGVYIDVI